MSYTPKVSVIIPVYNVEPYLRECLDSVVNQTLWDIEIICVNDGSTDNSGAIMEEYAAQDKRITVIAQENRGLSAARNVGIRTATGKYIYFIDSDDYIELDTLEVLYERAEESKVEILLFDFVNFLDGVNTIRYQPNRKGYAEIYNGVKLLTKLRDSGEFVEAVWAMFVERHFLLQSGVYFQEGIIYEDYLFTTLLMIKAERVTHIERKLYHRRLRKKSITTTEVSAKNVSSFIIALQEFMKEGIATDDKNIAFEIWRSIVTRQGKAKAAFLRLDGGGRDQIAFDHAFSTYLYKHFVIDAISGERQLVKLKKENEDIQMALIREQEKTSAAEQSAAAAWREVDNIHRSATYRIGRVITWVPRMVRGFVRCYREHGWRYTWHRVVVHIWGE